MTFVLALLSSLLALPPDAALDAAEPPPAPEPDAPDPLSAAQIQDAATLALLHGGRAAPRAWLAALRGDLWICWDDGAARGALDPGCWRRVDLPPIALDPRELRFAFLDANTLLLRADDDRLELARGDLAPRPVDVFAAAEPQGRLAPLACGPQGHVPTYSRGRWAWIAAACGAPAGECVAPPALPRLRRPVPLELGLGLELRARDDRSATLVVGAQTGLDLVASLAWSFDPGRWYSRRLAWDELQAARRPRLRPLPPTGPGPLAAREREALRAALCGGAR